MSGDSPDTPVTAPSWSDDERAEIEALAEAARAIASRRRFLGRSALLLAWALPVVETLTVVPDAAAQTHGKSGETHPPMSTDAGPGMMTGWGMM